MNFDRLRWEWRGWLMEKLHRLDEAIEAYKAAFLADPDCLRNAHLVGFLYEQSGRHAEAEAWLARVCEAEPGNGEAWFNLGFIRDKAHRWPEAIEAFRKAVDT